MVSTNHTTVDDAMNNSNIDDESDNVMELSMTDSISAESRSQSELYHCNLLIKNVPEDEQAPSLLWSPKADSFSLQQCRSEIKQLTGMQVDESVRVMMNQLVTDD